MTDSIDCPLCRTFCQMYAQWTKCGIRMCPSCSIDNAGQFGSCKGINTVQPIKR